MSLRPLAGGACLLLATLLAGCPQRASETSAPTAPTTAVPTDKPGSQATPAASMADADGTLGKRRIRTGGTLPPQLLPEPVKPDRSCRSDADCTVKDIGSCCGALPACVNVDSPADPAAVQAQCAREGKSSTCGYREISACQCVKGSCLAQAQALDPSIDPAPETR